MSNQKELINLEKGCLKGSLAWKSHINKVKEEKPEDFIFYTDVFGENRLSDLLEEFKDKDAIRKEVIENLEHYASFDLASMYCILKKKFS